MITGIEVTEWQRLYFLFSILRPFLAIFCVQFLYFDDKKSRLSESEWKIYLRDNFKT